MHWRPAVVFFPPHSSNGNVGYKSALRVVTVDVSNSIILRWIFNDARTTLLSDWLLRFVGFFQWLLPANHVVFNPIFLDILDFYWFIVALAALEIISGIKVFAITWIWEKRNRVGIGCHYFLMMEAGAGKMRLLWLLLTFGNFHIWFDLFSFWLFDLIMI